MFNSCMSPSRGPCEDFQLGLKVSANSVVILTQPSSFKMATINLLADQNGPQDWGKIVVWVIHLYNKHLLIQIQNTPWKIWYYITSVFEDYIILNVYFCKLLVTSHNLVFRKINPLKKSKILWKGKLEASIFFISYIESSF